MRYVRTALFYAMLVLSTIVLGLCAIGIVVTTRRSDWAHLCGRLWGNLNLWAAGVPVEVHGLERLTPDRPVVYAANHQSWFDIFTILGKLPVQFRWLAKEELFRIPLFGHAMRMIGYIPIDRADRKKAFASLEEASRRVREGASIVIFPEGTRSRDGVIQPFKKGGIILAIKSGQPIVPVSLSGSYSILPKGAWLVRPGRIRMTIGHPIETQGFSIEDRDKVIFLVREAIRQYLTTREGGVLEAETSTREVRSAAS
ncbi:1-acyl-sn-glycerol-3-phosphate acyltransferase [Desulfacinum hydrothermale DSM 13146]|uniref:1-acyl-sn-glycerol-3-phosphate acyltransferase n=1 Tax=Desulfacinum hydrothermale DSM 13146 TaxID=1121390 RepID=A0A1W1XL33_9BACT|nr:lysophospholipid acyltransferase family protein [Desulfacinum hydrothermale]SMC24514.1 1-acyl-sn-glycerol-3-phosphate acyltransferase [Desulfacinum hydrothermale DSM 13146]